MPERNGKVEDVRVAIPSISGPPGQALSQASPAANSGTAPPNRERFQIRLEGDRLYIGNKLLAQGTADMDDMPTLRKNLMAALDRARRQHPVAKYFR